MERATVLGLALAVRDESARRGFTSEVSWKNHNFVPAPPCFRVTVHDLPNRRFVDQYITELELTRSRLGVRKLARWYVDLCADHMPKG